MIEFKRILCPIDLSDCSDRAFRYATAMARWYGSHLTALHVFHDVPAVDIIPSLTIGPASRIALMEAERAQVVEAAEHLVEHATRAGVSVDLVIEDAANASRGILTRAATLAVDLIVMGTHGRSGFNRLLLGSVTEKVVRKTACPVMVVPQKAEGAVPPGDVGFGSILCAVDFSDASVVALTYALSLAEEADAHLTVLSVIETPPELQEFPLSVAFKVQELRAAAEAALVTRLDGLIPDAVRPFCRVETVIAEGKAYREILRVAAAQQSDAIVMGADGSGALHLIPFGSNTDHVVRAASCPVLIVRGH